MKKLNQFQKSIVISIILAMFGATLVGLGVKFDFMVAMWLGGIIGILAMLYYVQMGGSDDRF